MQTFFNQRQNSDLFSCCGNSHKMNNDIDQRKEEAIAEHIKVIAGERSQSPSEELTELMNYYLSVAG
jgi:hypothetical protein